MQWKKFDEVCCCVCKNVENSEMFAEDFFQHKYYGSVFTSLFLHSCENMIEKCYKGIFMFKTLLANLNLLQSIDA